MKDIKLYYMIIKTMIKKHLGWIVAVAIGLLLLFGTVKQCNDRHQSTVIDNINQSNLRRHLKDSIATALHRQYILRMDSIQSVRDAEIRARDKQIASLDKKYQKLLKELDGIYTPGVPVADLDTCNMVVSKQQEIILNRDSSIIKLKDNINEYKITVVGLNEKYVTQLKETERGRSMYNSCLNNNKTLVKELKKEQRFLRKNAGPIGFGIGVLATMVTVIAIK